MPAVGAIVSVITEGDDRLRAARPGAEERAEVGLQKYSDGSRYEGQFVNGLKHGRGTYTWKSGESYEGSFYKDFKHGDAVYCWPSGQKFIGKFYLNREEGYGELLSADGAHFQGLYHRGQRCGPGVLTYPDGHQDVGLWHDNRLLRLCTTVDSSFTLKDFPEYAAYVDTCTTAEECAPHQPSRDHSLDDKYILPIDDKIYVTDGDHLSLPPRRRREFDQRFYGDDFEPDPYQGCKRDPLSALPPEARMQANIHKHRLQSKKLSWDVGAVLSLTRTGFGPKGPLEVISEQLILQASRGDHRAVKEIVLRGADLASRFYALVHPDVADARGHTALIAATVNCRDDVIEVLLKNRANVDKLNTENMSALAVCHVLYYPFGSLHTTAAREMFSGTMFVKLKPVNNRPRTTETVQTQSHVFSEGAVDEETEVLQHSEVSDCSELVTERISALIDPQTFAEHELDLEEMTEDEQEVPNEEPEDPEEADLNEYRSGEVAGVRRRVDVKDGTVVVGSVQWTEYPAKREIPYLDESATFDSAKSVFGFKIHVTEEHMQLSAEALSRTGRAPSPDSQETVRKMAALKMRHRERLNTLTLLLERGADPNTCRVPMPVLFLAVMASDADAVKRLLLCGARTDIPLPPQRKGLFPLHVAAALPGPAGPKITELLLHAITDPDARACDQNDMYKTDWETNRQIRATVETRDREGGTTALHVACRRNTDYQNASKIVAILLSHGARTDLLWSGHSALSLAIASGNEMAVEELLKSGADPNVPLGKGVGSALCALAKNNKCQSRGNRQKLLDLLLNSGADILMPVLVDNVEGTAVDYAYYTFNQDARIATTPYHVLNTQEREIYKERQQLLRTMGNALRQTALQREREWQHRASTDGHETNGSSTPLFKFCHNCSRSAFVKLTSCNRCHKVFYCSKACKLKSWSQGHRVTCTRMSAKNAQLQASKTPGQRRARDAAQTNEVKSETDLKSKALQRALIVTCKHRLPRLTKFTKFELKPRTLNVTESFGEDQAGENYSYN